MCLLQYSKVKLIDKIQLENLRPWHLLNTETGLESSEHYITQNATVYSRVGSVRCDWMLVRWHEQHVKEISLVRKHSTVSAK